MAERFVIVAVRGVPCGLLWTARVILRGGLAAAIGESVASAGDPGDHGGTTNSGGPGRMVKGLFADNRGVSGGWLIACLCPIRWWG